MAGGATSPPILRAACKILVPGSTSMVILSIVTLNNLGASAIYRFIWSVSICFVSAQPPSGRLGRRRNFQRIGIMRQSIIARLRLHRILHMPLELVPEMADRCRYRPGRRISERTDGIAFDLALNIPEQVDIAHLALARK